MYAALCAFDNIKELTVHYLTIYTLALFIYTLNRLGHFIRSAHEITGSPRRAQSYNVWRF